MTQHTLDATLHLSIHPVNMQQHRKPTQAESLVAGVIAGAVEGFATYPAEFVKTKAQFSSSSSTKVSTAHQDPECSGQSAHKRSLWEWWASFEILSRIMVSPGCTLDLAPWSWATG